MYECSIKKQFCSIMDPVHFTREVDMRKLNAFIFTSLDGYFEGPKRDISWHRHDAEGAAFASKNLEHGSVLLFGRVTYQLMASYWPTPMAAENTPEVAAGMNAAEKIVFSRKLKKASWNNTRIVKGNIEKEIGRLKQMEGTNLTVLGSGRIVTQLAQKGLIDEFQIMVDPIALGKGTSLFKGLKKRVNLELVSTHAFKNGNVLLTYKPQGKG
jgi:dihydrofolate reductase